MSDPCRCSHSEDAHPLILDPNRVCTSWDFAKWKKCTLCPCENYITQAAWDRMANFGRRPFVISSGAKFADEKAELAAYSKSIGDVIDDKEKG